MTLAGATGGVTEGTTGTSRVEVLISGIAIFGAGAIPGSIVGLCGIDGLGATGVLKGGADIFCLFVGGKEATTSPGESENFTKMGLETR